MASALAQYLSRLPDGIAAYPQAQVKGAVVRALIESLPCDPRPASALPEVSALLCDPPHAGAWVREVHFNALLVETYDRCFAACGGMPAFAAWTRERNARLFRGPMYRVLFAVTSPERILVGASNRWSAFRRGSTVTVLSHSKFQTTVKLEQPPYLHHEVTLTALSSALRAGGELAGAHDLGVTHRELSPTEIQVDFRWL